MHYTVACTVTQTCVFHLLFNFFLLKRYYRRKDYFAFNFNFNLFFKIYDVCRNEKIFNQLSVVIHVY